MRTLVRLVAAAVIAAVSSQAPTPGVGAQALLSPRLQQVLAAQAPVGVPPTECAMVSGNWFRGERGCATLAMPELDNAWTVSPTDIGVNIFLGKPNNWRGQVSIMAWPAERAGGETAEDLALAQKLLESFTSAFAKSNPAMKAGKAACQIYSPGGKAMYQVFKGTGAGKQAMTSTFRLIADGKCALYLRAWYLDDARWEMQSKVVDPICDTIRVGSHVPKLPARDPGTVLAGVFKGPSRYRSFNNTIEIDWLIFDKRGYVLETDPSSVKAINLEAYYQHRPNSVGRYTVKDGEIEIVWPLGERDDKRKFEKVDDNTLKISGEFYRRKDLGTLNGKRLNGTWSTSSAGGSSFGSVETSYYSSNRYSFFENGKFKRGNLFSYNYNDNAGVSRTRPDLPGFTSTALANSSEYGVYAIEGDVIILRFADGTTSRCPVYPGSEDNKLLYLWGEGYLSEGAPGDPPPDMPGSAAAARPPAPFVPEVWRGGFLRARGGASTLRLPRLDPEQYSVRCEAAPAMTLVTVFKGKEAAKTPALMVVYALGADTFADDTRDDKTIARDTLKKMAENVLKNSPHLKPEGELKEMSLPERGVVCSRLYVGQREGGAREALSVIAVADNKCLVAFMTLAVAGEYNAFNKAVLTPTLNSVGIGLRQAKLEDQKPAVALSGVYCTEPDGGGVSKWLVFDPRGYLSDRAPREEFDLDIEAQFLCDATLIGRYEVKDGQIEMAFAPPREAVKAAFKLDGAKLTLGETVYYRVDGGRASRTGLGGEYELKSVTARSTHAAKYCFVGDGRFSTESAAAAGGARNADFRRADCVEFAAAPEKESTRGSYRLEGDRLLLWFEDGRRLAKLCFAAPNKPGALFIAGEFYQAGNG